MATATETTFQDDNNISTLGDTSRVPIWRRRWFQFAAGGALVLALVLAIVIPVSKRNRGSSLSADGTGSSTPYQFVPELPASEHAQNKQEFQGVLLEYYSSYGFAWDGHLDENSPQAKSLDWVTGSVTYLKYTSKARRIQRYVLGVFYYSTYAQRHDYYNKDNPEEALEDIPGWSSAAKWMSNADECEWEGIECDSDDRERETSAGNSAITAIYLREHQLSGILPVEIGFLGSLTDLDLTSNYIYVDGQADITPFSHLDQLRHLMLEDNYVVTDGEGFPPSMAKMTNLQKLSMSYNILQGPMDDGLFAQLSKLTHLEAESNFLNGELPVSLQESTELVYLYIRRNFLDISLGDLLEPPNLPSIFALWLDSNKLSGNIPRSIGEHTDLTSFSITNTSLTGPLPTEMGLLTGLRRVWLYSNKLTGSVPAEMGKLSELEVFEVYDNELTGSIPTAMCSTIQASDYEFKELSADCEDVQCEGCCTQCHYSRQRKH